MKTMKRSFVVVAFLTASSAFGQVAEFAVSGGINRLSNEVLGGDPPQGGQILCCYELDDGWRLAFRLTINNWRFFGQEFGYAYNRTKLQFNEQNLGGMAAHQGFYNFLAYATPEGSIVRPFVTGGGHFLNYVPPGTSVTQGGGDMKFGFNYGGGVKFRLGDRFMVRLDARQHSTGKPFTDSFRNPVSGRLKMNEFSVGFGAVM